MATNAITNSAVTRIDCGGCLETLTLDLANMEVRAKGHNPSLVWTGDAGQGLEMWDCPICGYADSYEPWPTD